MLLLLLPQHYEGTLRNEGERRMAMAMTRKKKDDDDVMRDVWPIIKRAAMMMRCYATARCVA